MVLVVVVGGFVVVVVEILILFARPKRRKNEKGNYVGFQGVGYAQIIPKYLKNAIKWVQILYVEQKKTVVEIVVDGFIVALRF